MEAKPIRFLPLILTTVYLSAGILIAYPVSAEQSQPTEETTTENNSKDSRTDQTQPPTSTEEAEQNIDADALKAKIMEEIKHDSSLQKALENSKQMRKELGVDPAKEDTPETDEDDDEQKEKKKEESPYRF